MPSAGRLFIHLPNPISNILHLLRCDRGKGGCVSVLTDARSHIDEVEAGRGEGEEEDEGEEGAIGDPHHPLEHRHLPLPGQQLRLRSQAGLGGTIQALNFHECAKNPETATGSARGGPTGKGRSGKEERGGSGRNEWEVGESGEGRRGRRGGRGGGGKREARRAGGGAGGTAGPEEAQEGQGRAFYPPGSGGRRGCRWGEARAARRGAPAETGSKLQHARALRVRRGPGREAPALGKRPARARQACAAASSGPRRLLPARG